MVLLAAVQSSSRKDGSTTALNWCMILANTWCRKIHGVSFYIKVNHLRASFLKYSLICICLERMRQTTITTKASIRIAILWAPPHNWQSGKFWLRGYPCILHGNEHPAATCKAKGALRLSDLNPIRIFPACQNPDTTARGSSPVVAPGCAPYPLSLGIFRGTS